MVRLNKFLADAGVASRRRADEMILAGKVQVNGKVMRELGVQIDPTVDQVIALGRVLKQPAQYIYFMINKPVGYVTTSDDPAGRKIVTELVPKETRVFSVGRLDRDTSGLLLLTNDGDLTYRLTHPKFEKEKEYLVKIQIESPNKGLNYRYIEKHFIAGVKLEEGLAHADKMKLVAEKGDMISFYMTLHQGWNRQIRRMCEAVGGKVIALHRVRMGVLRLGNLQPGQYRELTEAEVTSLKQ